MKANRPSKFDLATYGFHGDCRSVYCSWRVVRRFDRGQLGMLPCAWGCAIGRTIRLMQLRTDFGT